MGLFKKTKPKPPPPQRSAGLDERPAWVRDGMKATLSEGSAELEVVGESHYQPWLWHVVGGKTTDHVRESCVAVLVPEPQNPYDSNAIAVWVSGGKAGYLSSEDAELLLPGLLAFSKRDGGKPIAMRGVIVGGGIRDDGIGRLGVWLSYDPSDFGLSESDATHYQPPPPHITTGLHELLGQQRLRWFDRIPMETMQALTFLRHELAANHDPVERHFLFNEIEWRLYRARNEFPSALAEYDRVIRLHDAEMDTMRPLLVTEFGQVPVLDTYKQASIRHQKAKDFVGAKWWAERGLARYAGNCCVPEAVADLQQRLGKYEAKISQPPKATSTPVANHKAARVPDEETLVCRQCGREFVRLVAPGRKPSKCPSCRRL